MFISSTDSTTESVVDSKYRQGFSYYKIEDNFQYGILKMDLTKMSNEKKLKLSRWYFRIGFACLPIVWAVNALWFFNEAFRKPEYEEQKQIKKYVIFSAIGSIIWLVILTTWVIIFQVNRASWGESADYISFIIPVGTP